MTKIARTPPITFRTKILSFDLETNGLHGQAFAVGAVVMDASGTIHEEFTARTKLTGQVDPWVEQNVLPAIVSMPITHTSYKTMREAFWAWYLKAEPQADYVLVNNGYPVEYRFLLDCQEANLDERYWQHPFPILELSSLLLQVRHKLPGRKVEQLKALENGQKFLPHNPLHDAKAAIRLAFEAFKKADQL